MLKITKTQNTFTLLEVVIALAILTLGLIGYLNLITTVSKRINKSLNTWKYNHMIVQAAEYFLLTGEKDSIPFEFFPYQDYRISINILPPDSLPDNVEPEYDRWKLAKIEIKLTNSEGTELKTLSFEKIIPKNESLSGP